MARDDGTLAETLQDSSRAWKVDSPSTTVFDFAYEDGRDQLLRLYDKGTRR